MSNFSHVYLRVEKETEASRLINLVCGRKTLGRNAETLGGFLLSRAAHDVRYWHLADIG
jgi:hypothetical protein